MEGWENSLASEVEVAKFPVTSSTNSTQHSDGKPSPKLLIFF